MSVIQDALKRKLDEQKREAAEAPPPRSPSVVRASPQAPPVAQQVIENDPRSVPILSAGPIRSRPARHAHPAPVSAGARGDQLTTQLLLGAILFLLVAGFGGAVVYYFQARNQDLRAMSTSASAVQTPGTSAGPMGASGNQGAGMTAPPSNPGAAANAAASAIPQPALDPSAVAAPANAGATPEIAPEEIASAAAGASAPPPASESGWPLIRVEGVMAGATPSRSSALLNDQMIRVRQRVDGARLVEVRTEGVLLEFKGETRFVETGTTSLEYE